jgi:crotonobetainyl-CoA:carnitine CoA-transferase CaiB-like acyl-CoA transferase
MTAVDALEGAQLLEVPCSAVGERDAASSPWVLAHIAAGPPVERPFVVDLSSLWAGPLCGDLLQRAGAEVVKVEDPRRPDAARSAPPPLFDLLNGAKQSVAADLSSPSVHELLRRADVVISSARPRAFAPLGIDVPTILSASPTVWVAITAHGWSGNGANRVGFGDDAAAAAGLVAWPSSDHPVFVADAVADPLCGTLAAVAALSCLEAGGSWLIDAALVSAAAYTAGLGIGQPTVAAVRAGGAWLLEGETVAAPRARRPLRHAPPLGSDTASVLAL